MADEANPHAKCEETRAALRRQVDDLIVKLAMSDHGKHYGCLVAWFSRHTKPKSQAVWKFTEAIGEGSTVGHAMWKKYGGKG